MHFRHLLISGLVIGAVMFLPDNAFAEKNELSGQQDSQKASGQFETANAAIKPDIMAQEKAAVPQAAEPNVPAKEKAVVPQVAEPNVPAKEKVVVPQAAEPNVPAKEKVVVPQAAEPNVPAKEKAVAVPEAARPNVPAKGKTVVVPDRAMENQGRINQQPSKVSPNNPASQKSGAGLENLPEQAKGNVKSALNKAEKAVKAHESKKGTAVGENHNGLGKNAPAPESGSGNSALNALHNSEIKIQSIRVEPQGENKHLSMFKNENRSESLVPEPQEKGNIPSGEQEIPKAASQVPHPTQRTSSHEGPSNDRVGKGLSTISFPDKWLTWNPYYETQFIQFYFSRQTWLINQWVNAPPSPPPQEAPLLETVNRS